MSAAGRTGELRTHLLQGEFPVCPGSHVLIVGVGGQLVIRVSVCSPLSGAKMKPPFLLVPLPPLRLFHSKE